MLIVLADMKIIPIEEGFEMERAQNVAWPAQLAPCHFLGAC
jgi:hypothetical protein